MLNPTLPKLLVRQTGSRDAAAFLPLVQAMNDLAVAVAETVQHANELARRVAALEATRVGADGG